jgi:TonB family protein
MPRSLALIPLTLALIAQPALAADKPPISLAKTSKWEMQYNEDSCSLIAQFGAGDTGVLLVLTRTSPNDWFELKLYGKMLRHGAIALPIDVAFGEQPLVKYMGMHATTTATNKSKSDETHTAIVPGLRIDGWKYPTKPTAELSVPTITAPQEQSVKSISFKMPGAKVYRLQTESLGPPFAAMRACTDDLLRHWGYDPAVQTALSRPTIPTENPGRWLRSSDFPTKPLSQGMNGYVRFRLDVDETGKVAGCRILYRTNPDEFADLSCQLISKRAKFTPALDAKGAPVKSFYINQIRWQSGEW